MNPDDLDRILSEPTGIVPSSGFTSGVMAAVRHEASAPPPIPFPWKRALPGLAAGVFALVAILIVIVKSTPHPASSATPSLVTMFQPVIPTLDLLRMYGMDWALVAILVTAASVTLSMRLTAGTWRSR
jgi:hypothetical protein